jgi:EpsI family protein
MGALNGLPARILALVLLLQAVAYYAVASREEIIPDVPPLSEFPRTVGGWGMTRDFPVEKEVQEVLRADDLMSRVYMNPQQTAGASLFMAFFKTQRYGQAPHSPKNCLPGSGWEPKEDSKRPVVVPGMAEPIVVKKYLIERGDQKSLVLYWYQSHNRVIAGELTAKFWLVVDAVRHRRSDTALIRIIVPVQANGDEAAERTAIEFVRAVYPDIARQLPR